MCSRESLINEWDAQENYISKWVHSLVWTGQEQENWWKIMLFLVIYQWVVIFYEVRVGSEIPTYFMD
jgi:hypothetical protein